MGRGLFGPRTTHCERTGGSWVQIKLEFFTLNCGQKLFGGIAQLVERLGRNESTADLLTLSHALTRVHVEGRGHNRGYLTLSHVC